MGPTDPNFWQTKIIIILISHINISFFTIYISCNLTLVLMDNYKIHKNKNKQKFSALDFIES